MRFPPRFDTPTTPAKASAPNPTSRKLTKAQFNALGKYAEVHGHYWKHKLRDDWASGKCEGELQQIRSNLGPRWLKDFKFISYTGMVWD